jgi:DNA-binding NarL/FixJ family response regulator
MEKEIDARRSAEARTPEVQENRNAVRHGPQAVERVESVRTAAFRIECPYPLLNAALARALEGTQLRHRQGPLELGLPCTVVLWAEDQVSLYEGIERVRKASPDASVLVLGLHEDLPLAMAALKAGARGFVHAGMNPDQVARAISVVARGEEVVPRWMLRHLVDEVTYKESAKLSPLTSRQREVLALVAEDLSNVEIAQRLFLTESTVKQHLRAAYKVLGVNDRTEAAKLTRDANSAGVGRKVKR